MPINVTLSVANSPRFSFTKLRLRPNGDKSAISKVALYVGRHEEKGRQIGDGLDADSVRSVDRCSCARLVLLFHH